MRTSVFLMVIAFLLVTAAVAEEKSPVSIPVYPNADVGMEINMNGEELISMLPLLGSGLVPQLNGIEEETLQEVFKDIKKVEVLQMEYAKNDAQIADFVSFYTKKIPDGTWNRIYYSKGKGRKIVSVYAKDGANELYGFQIKTAKANGKTIKQVDVARIIGRINFEKLIDMALPIVTEMAK